MRNIPGSNYSMWQRCSVFVFAAIVLVKSLAEDIIVVDSRERPMMYVNEFGYDFEGNVTPMAVEGSFVKISQVYFNEPIEKVIFTKDVNHHNFGTKSTPNDPYLRKGSKNPLWPRDKMILRKWTIKDGLPFNKVRSLLRTKKGIMWIGTENGLARFDGRRIKTIIQGNQDLNLGSPQFRFQALFEDEEDTLWAGSQGVTRLKKEQAIPFPGSELLINSRIFQIVKRHSKGHWICTSNGLAYWDEERVQWKKLKEIEELGEVFCVLQEENTIMIGCSDGLYHYDLTRDQIISHEFRPGIDIDHFLKKMMLLKISVKSIYKDGRDSHWLSTNALGIYRRQDWKSSWSPIAFQLPTENPLALPYGGRITGDSRNQVLIGSVGGIHILSQSAPYLNSPILSETFGEVFDVMEDEEKSIWIGTRQGLFQLIPQKFASLWHDGTGARNNLQSGNFLIAELPNGGVVVQRSYGMSMLQQNRLQSVNHQRLSYISEPTHIGRQSLVDSQGNWWSYYPGGGLFRMAHMQNGYLEFTENFTPQFPEIGHVHAMAASQTGGLWVGTPTGVFKALPDTSQISRPFERELEVACLTEDSHGTLWIGTHEEGLFEWDGGRLKSWSTSSSLKQETIQCLHLDEDTLWIGAQGTVYRLEAGNVTVFDQKAGIPEQRIDGLITDPYGALWLNHDAGISRVMIRDLETWASSKEPRLPAAIAHYDMEDGLLHTQNTVSPHKGCLLASDGRLWFTKGGSIVMTDPKRFIQAAPAPQTFVESIQHKNESFPVETEVVIPAESRESLTIDFTCTSLHSPNRLLIQYQLEGVDTDWRKADLERRAIYTHLPKGSYTFKLRARNHEGRWSENETTLQLQVQPFLWETTGFKISASLLILVSALGYTGLRLRRVRHELELKRQVSIQTERKRIARDIHDHLGARLAQTALSLGKDEEQSRKLAKESLKELKTLIWAIDPDNDTLAGLIGFIADTATQFCTTSGHALELDLPDEIPDKTLPHELRTNILAVVKETFTNIHKHAQAYRIELKIWLTENQLKITIQDNGIGFDPQKPNNIHSNGLTNMRHRMEQIEGRITIQSKPGTGTRNLILTHI